MSNVFLLKYFVINYVLNFMYMYNAQWKIYPKWKYYDFVLHAIIAHVNSLGCVSARACAIACVSGNSMTNKNFFLKTDQLVTDFQYEAYLI